MDNWPFEQPPNEAVLTTKAVLDGGWIFRASRDDDDGMWQFHTPEGNQDLREEDGRLVSLQLVWQLDPSVAELADLPPGWTAWREAIGKPWSRSPQGGTAKPGWRSWLSSLWPFKGRPQ